MSDGYAYILVITNSVAWSSHHSDTEQIWLQGTGAVLDLVLLKYDPMTWDTPLSWRFSGSMGVSVAALTSQTLRFGMVLDKLQNRIIFTATTRSTSWESLQLSAQGDKLNADAIVVGVAFTCSQGCLDCASATECRRCSSVAPLLYQGQCYSSCASPLRYVASARNDTCFG